MVWGEILSHLSKQELFPQGLAHLAPAASTKNIQGRPESVIQSEVSQKEKNKYIMLTHIYGI